MFILGDETHDRGKIPWVTFTLIALNILFFTAQIRFGERLTNGYALTAKEITEFKDLVKKEPIKVPGHRMLAIDDDGDPILVPGPQRIHYIHHYPGPFPIVLTVFTYMFLHADFLHLLFNMWFLFVFGRNVECSLGAGRFFGFYIVCGALAGLSHVFTDMASVVPMVGASGAIAGVMGAYLAIFPNNTINVWIGGLLGAAMSDRGGTVFGGVCRLPAVAVIGFWFFGQYMAGVATMNEEMLGGTAYWCHIGGFLAGFCSIKGIVLYLRHEISKLEAERGEVEAPLVDALKAPAVPTLAQIDAILDPVEAFRKARAGVFRDTEANDPFHRPEPAFSAGLSDRRAEADDLEHGITASPKFKTDMQHAIVVKK